MSSLSSVLNIVIVLSAVYLAISCATSWIQEQIAAVLRLRGVYLYRGVLNLVVGNRALVEAIFTHPNIAASSNDRDGKIVADGGRAASNLADFLTRRTYRPSYIDARNFSLAFWDSVRKVQAAPNGAAVAGVADGAAAVADLRARVNALGAADSDLQRALGSLLTEAGGDFTKLLAATDAWFNRQMDRVEGWYKRMSQWLSLPLAFVLVSLTGIDTLNIATRLYVDPALQSRLVADVSTLVPSPSPSASTPVFDRSQLPHLIDTVAKDPKAGELYEFDPIDSWRHHTLGIFLTILAVTLGAPFWFDVLSGLVNVRSAGLNPSEKAASATKGAGGS